MMNNLDRKWWTCNDQLRQTANIMTMNSDRHYSGDDEQPGQEVMEMHCYDKYHQHENDDEQRGKEMMKIQFTAG